MSVELTESTQVDGILFTGSAETGQHIHRQLSGKPETMLAMEMEGITLLLSLQILRIWMLLFIRSINLPFLHRVNVVPVLDVLYSEW